MFNAMKTKVFIVIAISLLFSYCTQDYIPEQELTNKEMMNQLVIDDPLVWNSLITQAIEIDTTGSGMKAGTDLNGLSEYPKNGYYYAMFEDLFPAQGDYDFNDVILETKLYLDGKQGEFWGKMNTTVYNRGGSLKTRLGVMFYSVKGNKEYTVMDNETVSINGKLVSETHGDQPYTMDMPAEGSNFDLEFYVTDRTNNSNQIWIAYYLIVEPKDKEPVEVHSAGFPISKTKNFELPQRDFLTTNNLPWGLEVEAEKFYVVAERELFLDAFPEFSTWAESNGSKNKTWYMNPNFEYIQK